MYIFYEIKFLKKSFVFPFSLCNFRYKILWNFQWRRDFTHIVIYLMKWQISWNHDSWVKSYLLKEIYLFLSNKFHWFGMLIIFEQNFLLFSIFSVFFVSMSRVKLMFNDNISFWRDEMAKRQHSREFEVIYFSFFRILWSLLDKVAKTTISGPGKNNLDIKNKKRRKKRRKT